MKLAVAAILIAASAVPALAAESAVMAADRAFSKLSVEKGQPYAFWFNSSKSARFYGPSGPPKIGKAAKAPPVADAQDSVLSWEPTAGAADGKLGWTDGVWKLTGAKGNRTGHYLTVWVKEDGVWKVQADIGTTDPAPKDKP